MTVVAGAADAGESTHPFHRERALRQRGRHRLDDRIDPLTPGPVLGWRGSLTCRKACRKKIEFDLLLADLALQFGNTPAGRRKVFARPVRRRLDHLRRRRAACRPRRPAAPAQGLRTTRQEAIAPSVQILARQLEFAPQGAHILARQKPADDAELKLSVENPGRLGLGHMSSYGELLPISRVSLLGCTPSLLAWISQTFLGASGLRIRED